MAAFGAPAALEDHAERALHAALAMRERLPELDPSLALRIGVNTGEVVVDPDAHSTFVTGDAVNVCARLEQGADPGQIVVGERTAQAARGAFEFGEPAARRGEGQERARRLPAARAVAGGGPATRRPRAAVRRPPRRARRPPRRVRTRDRGRRAAAGDRLRRSRRGQEPPAARAVGVARGFARRAPSLRVGRCLSYGSARTYWPVREILQEQLGALDDRPILGLAFGRDVAGDLHPLAARDRFRDAWVELLNEACAQGPVVLLVEDVHWAEAPLLELLERTVRDVRGPLLVVATARPELEWGGGRRHVTAIELEPLADEVAAQLVADLPEDVRDLLVRRSEGNPFFVEELIESLVDSGVLVQRDDRWEVAALPEQLSMPDSVRGVLAARIDLLPAREKAALQAASVIGRVFWEAPVRELIGGDADFALLEERDFIRRRTGSRFPEDREHAIKHALTREAAYAGHSPCATSAHARGARGVDRAERRERRRRRCSPRAPLRRRGSPGGRRARVGRRRRRARANAGEGARVAPARGRRCDAALRTGGRARPALAGASARCRREPTAWTCSGRPARRTRSASRASPSGSRCRTPSRRPTTSRCGASSTPSWPTSRRSARASGSRCPAARESTSGSTVRWRGRRSTAAPARWR